MKVDAICLFVILSLFSCKKNSDKFNIPPLKGGDTQKRLKVNENISTFILNDQNPIHIKVPDNASRVCVDSLVRDYRYIALETKDESLIGNISKICTDSSFIFVFDRRNNTVFSFSDTGKFLGKFGEKGRGPKEYIRLYDMSLDKYRKEVCLLDVGGKRMIFYTYSGDFIREEFLYYYFYNIEFLEKELVLYTGLAYNKNVSAIKNSSLVVAQYNQNPFCIGFLHNENVRKKFHWEIERPFVTLKKEIFFHHLLSDTIWQVRNKSCEARYVLKFPGRNNLFSYDDFQKITDEYFSVKTNKINFFCGNYLMTTDFIYFGIVNEQKIIVPLIYNKSSGNLFYGMFDSNSNKENMGYNLLGSSFDFVFEDSSFVKIIQPFEALRYLKQMEINISKLSPKDRKLFENLKEEDNPVLMLVNLKNF